MHYVLRRATDSDREWLEDLRRRVYQDLFHATWGHWDEVRHQRHFADCWDRGGIQLVEIEGYPVGMLQLSESDELLEIGEVQVHPDHQGAGIGTQLLLDVIGRARERNKDVVLSTGLMNLGAARLYERLGFAETERSDTHVQFRYSTRPR
jgi:ribosomal protein S18 acetylase RimI-like enzyme